MGTFGVGSLLSVCQTLVYTGTMLLVLSTGLLAAGLIAAWFLGRRGVALQSVALRTTLASFVIFPAVSLLLGLSGMRVVSLDVPPARLAPAELAVPGESYDILAPVTRQDVENASTFPKRAPVTGSAVAEREAIAAPADNPDTGIRVDPLPSPEPGGKIAFLYPSLAVLWLLVSAALLIRLSAAHWRMAQVRRIAKHGPADLVDACRALARGMRIRPPALLVSTHVKAPCLIGLLRPAILLPEADIARRSSSTHDVIVHELAHLARRDCLWNLLGRMASAVFFFQPLVWSLVRQLERMSERVVDDFVVYHGAKPSDYARMLVEVAERCQPIPSVLIASTGVSQFNSFLGRRVQRILDSGRSLSVRVDFRAAAAIIVAGIVGTVAFGSIGLADAVGPACPTDLGWLRSEVGDGALVHHADGRIYLTELSSGETVHVGNGDQPEFSLDGTKFAWIDGRTAKGRMRKGDTSIHVIAENIRASGGIHWLTNTELALVIGKKWFRVKLGGGMTEIPELTALGLGGYECDVKLGDDGIWSYVAKETWRTSDGRRGRVAGSCSVSLSPDGRSVTSLHRDHTTASIQAIRPGGTERTLRWEYGGGFDNHRWASNNTHYIVVVDEIDQKRRGVTYPVVMRADGSRSTRMGNRGFAQHMVYGDFVVGDGEGGNWSDGAHTAQERAQTDPNRSGALPEEAIKTTSGATTTHDIQQAGIGRAALRISGMRRGERAVIRVLAGDQRQSKVDEKTIAELKKRAIFTKEINSDASIAVPKLPEGTYTIYAGAFSGRSRSVRDALRSLRHTFGLIEIVANRTTDVTVQLPGFGRAALWVTGMRQGERAVILVLVGDQRQSKVDEKTIGELKRRACFTKEIRSDAIIEVPDLTEGMYTVYANALNGRARSVRDALQSLRYTFDLIEIAQNKTTDVPVRLTNAKNAR